MITKTGSYLADGVVNTAVTVGFSADVIIVKAATAAGSTVWCSPIMGADSTAFMGLGAANSADIIKSITSTGFTIGTDANVNTAGVTYYWTAIKSAGPSDMVVSSYVGNGTAQDIITPFTPVLVWIKRPSTTNLCNWKVTDMPSNEAQFFNSTATTTTAITSLNSNGFSVGTNTASNTNTVTYYYAAFSASLQKIITGTYEGTGVARTLSILDRFNPAFFVVKTGGQVAYQKSNTMPAVQSVSFQASALVGGRMTGFSTGSVTLGTIAQANSNGSTYYYFGFSTFNERIPATGRTLLSSRVPL